MIDDMIMKKIRYGLLGVVVIGAMAESFTFTFASLGVYLMCLEFIKGS